MEEIIRTRIKEVLTHYNLTQNQVAEGNQALQVKLSRQINQGATLSCQTIMFILGRFPEISAEWLLRGKGSMFSGSESAGNSITLNNGNINAGDHASQIISDSASQLAIYKEKIDMLKERIEEQKERIAELKETIALYKNK